MTADKSFSHSESVGILGTNGHEPPLGTEGRRVMPAPRFKDHPEDADRLLEAISQLVDGLRDMTTSWSVERSDLIKDVRAIREKMVDLERVKDKVESISEFIEGGAKGHLGERIHGHDLQIRTLESSQVQLANEKSKTFWAIIGLAGTLAAGLIVEGFRLFFEYGKH